MGRIRGFPCFKPDEWILGTEENSSTFGFTWNITPDFQVNPAIYFANYHPERIMGYVFFTCTFHLWGADKGRNEEKNDKR